MRVSRVFVEQALHAPAEITLTDAEAHYLSRVLRVKAGFEVILFNGQGGEYRARVVAVGKKDLRLEILSHATIERESHLPVTLAQGIAKPEHMDIIVQKAVELGVQRVVPVITEYTQHFDPKRCDKRQQHWRKIMLNACMQCGRNRIPTLSEPVGLQDWLSQKTDGSHLVLAPGAKQALTELRAPDTVTLLVGAEGGFSGSEMAEITTAGYVAVGLGARILRAETAALGALAAVQIVWGDMR
jgi:16S rRNA (uracil1498-N3)-methyltransferase